MTSPRAPIVLVRWREDSDIAAEVAPRPADAIGRYLGVMLPYTPLHHILLADVARPLVMTSGNLSEEPIAAENDEAMERLGSLADALLLHDRGIHARYDDAVWFVPEVLGQGRPQPVRRARGEAPFPVRLPMRVARQVLACGAELKNTFCLARDEYAFVSQHIGDVEQAETLAHLERTLALYQRLFHIAPEVVAVDPHPGYLVTRLGREFAARSGARLVEVQHHHAHVASCLAGNGWRAQAGQVIGVALDGTGYGPDGCIWGGEWLVADYRAYRRAAHLEYLPLAGGVAAVRNPWRIAAGYLHALGLPAPEGLVPTDAAPGALQVLQRQVDRALNAPRTSSMGRLFDAVAALVGVGRAVTYEAQAAMELEMLAGGVGPAEAARLAPYAYGLQEGADGVLQVLLGSLLRGVLGDLEAGRPRGEIARRFHATVAHLTVDLCRRIADRTGLRSVALSGGCYQNRLLLSLTVEALEAEGFSVLLQHQVPANDGGLSLGQVAVAHDRS